METGTMDLNNASITKPARRMTASRMTTFDYVNNILLFGVVIITFVPFLYILVQSISDPVLVSANRVGLIPKGITLVNYIHVAQVKNIWISYGNTVYYTLLGTFVNIVMSFITAFPLSRNEFIFRKFFLKMITITMYISGGLIPTYIVVTGLGMYDTVWALVIPGCMAAYNLIVIMTFMRNLPQELMDAALIDGCNDMKMFMSIVIPLSIPILATMALFAAVGYWNSYYNALIYLKSSSKMPLQLYLRNVLIQGTSADLKLPEDSTAGTGLVLTTGLRYAVIIFATLPILCVYPFIQRYFVKGMLVGSLKG